MNDVFIKNALSNGKEGKKWLKDIPLLIPKYEKKWHFKARNPYKLNYNYVAPVVLSDGKEAVLKIGFFKDKEFQTEIQALTIFNGESCVKIINADKKNCISLLEKLSPGKSLSSLEDDDKATIILANLMKKLRKPLPSKHNFPNISVWGKALPKLRQRFNGGTGPIPSYLVKKVEQLLKESMQTSGEPMLLHGDLHHDNVLSSKRDNWLAIDPKGVAAEPAYETAAMIRNPYEKLKKIPNLKPILERRIMLLSKELGLNPTRIHNWCLVQTIISSAWNVEGAKGPEHAIRVAQVLEEINY